MNKSKSPYATRLRKQSPRPAVRTAKPPSHSLVQEVMLARPAQTRVVHRMTHSLGVKDVGAIKVVPVQLFANQLELEVIPVPLKPSEPKAKRNRQISPRTMKRYPLPNPILPKSTFTPKSTAHHRRALSLIEEFPQPSHTSKHSLDYSTSAPVSVVAKSAFATRKGLIPGNPAKVNQDSYVQIEKLPPGISLFSVCDGHGLYGHEVSRYLTTRIPKGMSQDPMCAINPGKTLAQWVLRCNQEVLMGSIDSSLSGSTFNAVVLQGSELWCANVGDSRAVLGRRSEDDRSWATVSLSRDHKPDLRDEAERITAAGGRIAAYMSEDGSAIGPARVWLQHQDLPGLAMSRSIGDSIAAAAGVIGTPEVLHLHLTNRDKFIIVGSDGVFEFLSSEEVVKTVGTFWDKKDALGACQAVEKEAHAKWAQVRCRQDEDVIDDITVVVAFLEVP